MAVVLRSLPRFAWSAALVCALTHCSTAQRARPFAVETLPGAAVANDERASTSESTASSAESSASGSLDDGPELEPEFRVETIERDLARQAALLERRSAPQTPPEPIAGVPVKRLVPEWQPIAPDDDDEVSDDDTTPLPRRARGADEGSDSDLLPGTVAESSAEDLDELYSASAHLGAGRTERALVDARRFLDRDPRHAYADRAERLIVQALFSAGEWTLAIAAANRLEASFPGTLAAKDAVRFRERALAALGHPVGRDSSTALEADRDGGARAKGRVATSPRGGAPHR
jgi:hypothetical protein